MNITKQQLKQIIHEESQTVLKEFEPKRADQQLSPAELAQRKAKQAQMKKDYAAREKVRAAKHAKSEKGIKDKRAVRKSARDAANLEDVEMHDAPIQGAETDDDVVRDLVRSNARRFNAKQYMHSPSKIRDVVKRARQFEAKFTKQQLEQLIREELQSVIQEENKVYDARQELNSVFSLIKKAADLMSDLQANVYNKGYSNEKALLDLAAEIYHVSRLTKQGLAKANGVRGGL